MSGRAQMASTRRGGLRADAARDRKPRNKGKNKGKDKDKKRPKRPKRLPDTQPGRQLDNSAFRWFLAETRSAKRLEITDIVESVEWSDSSDSDNVNSWPILSATLAVRKSPSVAFPDLTPNRIVDCFCEGERIWRARIVKPTSSAIDGSVSIELQDELRQLALPRANFRYVADKAHKGGWSPDEIAKDICRQYKIPYVRFLVMRVNGTGEPIRLAKVEKKKASPFDVIQYAYEEARKRSAHRYIMRWNTEENGLEAVPMVESDTLYAFYARQISDAQSEMTLRTDFCTALRVTWYKPKPKKASSKWKPKKQTLKFPVYKDGKKVYSGRGKKKKAKTTNVLLPPNANDVISRYGYVERRVEFSARNIKEARARAKSELAKRLRPKKTLTFTAPGEPNIRRGDFIKVNLPEQGFDLTQVWVQSVTHSIGDRYTMEVTARFDNPFSPSVIKREQQKAARYKKAAERKEKGKGKGTAGGIGGWVRVGATVDNYSGGPVACGNQYKNNGFSYAELGVAGANEGMAKNGGFLADVFGVRGNNGLPCGYKLQVRNLPTRKNPSPRAYTIIKVDNGSGQQGDSRYKIDLEPGITRALNFPGKGFVEIRRAA